jgi:hypothetical protein
LSGDFNIDVSTEKSNSLIDFLKTALDLNMSNDPKESIATEYGTTIDGVFLRYLNRFESKVFISYFSHHNHNPVFLIPPNTYYHQ